jgi:transposase
MSGDRTTPRFEVIASTRRSWSVEQKRAIIGEIGVGEATLSDVARRHGIHTSLLFRWRRDLGAEVPTTASEPHRSGTPSAPRPALSFVPVMLAQPAQSAPAAVPCSLKSGALKSAGMELGTIEIVIAGGRTVRVGPDVDASALVRIIAALETSR